LHRLRHTLLVILAAAFAGCGNSRTAPPSLNRPLTPSATRIVTVAPQGLQFRMPRNWALTERQPPLVATISSGPAIVALWRYPRQDPLPGSPAALEADARRLVAAIRRQDPTVAVIRSGVSVLSGRAAVEVDAFEHIGGQLRRVRSVHLFVPGAEVVLDAYAPVSEFHQVDHLVFSPLKRSLRVSSPSGA
jgi:hypothetical protein